MKYIKPFIKLTEVDTQALMATSIEEDNNAFAIVGDGNGGATSNLNGTPSTGDGSDAASRWIFFN